MTRRTCLGSRALCCARSITGWAVLLAWDGEFYLLAECGFLKRDLEIIAQVSTAFGSLSARTSSAAHAEHIKDIVHVEAAESAGTAEGISSGRAAAPRVEGIMAKLVVCRLLLRILHHIVRLVELLEFLLGSLGVVTIEIGVVFAREFLICLFDFIVRGTLLDP